MCKTVTQLCSLVLYLLPSLKLQHIFQMGLKWECIWDIYSKLLDIFWGNKPINIYWRWQTDNVRKQQLKFQCRASVCACKSYCFIPFMLHISDTSGFDKQTLELLTFVWKADLFKLNCQQIFLKQIIRKAYTRGHTPEVFQWQWID